ncbi:hypothetical protein Aab01nite_06020 [Paractinoplanes abujensis]|nr:hypothetical protein Aab01nite_06020 [Actinoplanes abujensis]
MLQLDRAAGVDLRPVRLGGAPTVVGHVCAERVAVARPTNRTIFPVRRDDRGSATVRVADRDTPSGRPVWLSQKWATLTTR